MFLEPSRTLQLLRRLRAFWSLGMSVTPRLKPEVASSASSTYLFWDQQQVKMGADLRQSCKQLYLQRHLEPKKDMLYSKGYLWRRSRQVFLALVLYLIHFVMFQDWVAVFVFLLKRHIHGRGRELSKRWDGCELVVVRQPQDPGRPKSLGSKPSQKLHTPIHLLLDHRGSETHRLDQEKRLRKRRIWLKQETPRRPLPSWESHGA
ncbi:unnamed protein product [Prunus armeniaca]|uniref:Uncharacterized protein n=1 Tax=Prunus armeniaca TaxID=36596 RepID=A0A6J5XDF9_PRUAR|nr:unnamed protein product [Prunus armeniaca]